MSTLWGRAKMSEWPASSPGSIHDIRTVYHASALPRLKEEIHVAPKTERRGREERRRETRRRRKESPQTIQSHSIFEQGPADSTHRTGGASPSHTSPSGASPPLTVNLSVQAGVVLQTSMTPPPPPQVSWWRKRGSRQTRMKMKCSLNYRGTMWVVSTINNAGGRSRKQLGLFYNNNNQLIMSQNQYCDMQFIDDPGLRNDAKLTPIQLPLCQSHSFSTSATRENTRLFLHTWNRPGA